MHDTGIQHDTVVVVTGNEPLDPRSLDHLPADAIVIAADGGLDHALAAGLRPSIVVGDLDSVSQEGLVWAETHAVVERHPVDKDHTDTELAVERAGSMDPERVLLVAGGGDRLDHTLAALGALGSIALTGVPVVECWWGGQFARIVHGPGRAVVHTRPGARVSLLAAHGPCAGVSLGGTRWELERLDLAAMVGRGVSNVAEQHTVTVELTLGVLTVFVDPPAPAPEPAIDRAATQQQEVPA